MNERALEERLADYDEAARLNAARTELVAAVVVEWGPLAVALAPALAAGWAVYDALAQTMPGLLAVAVGVVSAVGWEVAGLTAARSALDGRRGWGKALDWSLLGAYAFGGAGLMMALGDARPAHVAGVAMFAVALVSYLARARRLAVRDGAEADAVGRALERELALAKAETDKAVRLERERQKPAMVKAKAKVGASMLSQRAEKELALEPAKPAQPIQECQDCGRTFGTVQAMNAHKRFCAGGVISQNGKLITVGNGVEGD